MKQTFLAIASFYLVTATTLSGQIGNNAKLLNSYVFLQLDADTGVPYIEDSTIFNYNNENLLVEKVGWGKSTLHPSWSLRHRIHAMTYNMDGNLLTEERQQRSNNAWSNYARYTYSYDAAGHKIRQVQDKWNLGVWVLENDTQWQYDTTGHILSEKSSSSETLYTYNTDGFIATITTRLKDNTGWTNLTKDIYQYVEPGSSLPASILQQQWNVTNWLDFNRFLYDYDLTGNVTGLTTQYLVNNAWVDNAKQSFIYNMDGNLIYLLAKRSINGVLENDSQQTLSYDSDGDIESTDTEHWYDGAWHRDFLQRYHYDIASNTNDPGLAKLDVFPNPATGSITLSGEGFILANLFDPQGRLMLSQRLQGQPQETIQLIDLPSGNYLLQVIPKSPDQKVEAKFVQIRN